VHLDLTVAAAGFIVGLVVGLTGMGGGALMTPILVLFFNVQPLAAVSSDLVASFIMKPVGAGVHLRRGTVHRSMVGWLMLGSVPAAFAGVLVIRALGDGQRVQDLVQIGLGAALILAAGTLALKAVMAFRDKSRGVDETAGQVNDVKVRPLPTILIGVVGGLVVGMTSVGSGSLIIVALLFLYPRLKASQLVGTDLVQAIPLVGSAALGHLLFGDFRLGLTTSLVLGSIPAVYIGARFSSHASSVVLRRVLAFVLLASGLKLVQVGNVQLGVIMVAVAGAALLVWAWARATDRMTSTRPLGVHAPASQEA
jgi:uncharacterized protein